MAPGQGALPFAIVATMATPANDGPVHRYYRALEGQWSGTLTLTITDPVALRGYPLSTRAMMTFSRLLGPVLMQTTLAASGAAYRHTTRVSRAGIPLFVTSEIISPGDDGRSLRMSGEQRTSIGAVERYDADGEVDDSATRATYRIPWLGAPLVQRTRIVDEGLELTQETPWSRAEVLLRRAAR